MVLWSRFIEGLKEGLERVYGEFMVLGGCVHGEFMVLGGCGYGSFSN